MRLFGWNLELKRAATNMLLQQQAPRIIGGQAVYSFGDLPGAITSYCTIDDVYSVITKRAKTAARVPLYEYKIKDDKAYNVYRVKQRNAKYASNIEIKALVDMQHKALEIVGENGKLQRLLDNPNDIESKQDFYEGLFIFILSTGNRYVYLDKLDAGANAGMVQNMYNLSPVYAAPIAGGTFPQSILGYEYNLYGKRDTLATENILHSKYFNPNFSNQGQELVGLSPLQVGYKTVQQLASEKDYAVAALQNSGAYGLAYAEEADLGDTAQLEALSKMKQDFYNETSGTRNARKIAFTAGKYGWLQFGISPADMQLIEQNKMSFKKLCNLYQVSDILFNNSDEGTENNVKIQTKAMYTNAVLPDVTSWRDIFNKGVAIPSRTGTVVDYDITEITELQEDMTAVASRFANAPAFRPNDLYEAMGFGRLDVEGAEEVFIKNGYQLLSDALVSGTIPTPAVQDYIQNPLK